MLIETRYSIVKNIRNPVDFFFGCWLFIILYKKIYDFLILILMKLVFNGKFHISNSMPVLRIFIEIEEESMVTQFHNTQFRLWTVFLISILTTVLAGHPERYSQHSFPLVHFSKKNTNIRKLKSVEVVWVTRMKFSDNSLTKSEFASQSLLEN